MFVELLRTLLPADEVAVLLGEAARGDAAFARPEYTLYQATASNGVQQDKGEILSIRWRCPPPNSSGL